MSVLSAARELVVSALKEANVNAFDHLPAPFSPPLAIVAAADPYVTTEGQPFGTYRMNLEVRLVVRGGSNDQVADDLDTITETVLKALEPTTFAVEEVSQPYNLTVGTQGSYAAVSVRINDDLTLV